jgi:MFS transporter, FHS family, L-fucose permease
LRMSTKTMVEELAIPTTTEKVNYTRPIIIIGALFFVFGFVTWLNSVLIPYLKIACELNNFESYLVAFAFYISYLVMAIPSAKVLKRTGFKKGMSAGLLVMAFGALIFIPAAIYRTYEIFLLGLFTQGAGLALLQTASNPYITILGPLESAAKRISIMGISNKVAGAIAPIALGAVTLNNVSEFTEKVPFINKTEKIEVLNALAARVINPYILMTIVLIILGLMIYYSSLPEIDTDKSESSEDQVSTEKSSILQFPHLILGMVTLFFYIGVEVLAGDTIISYASSQGIDMASAKYFTSFTLIGMVIGYVIGIATIPRLISQELALKVCGILGIIFSITAIFTTGATSVFFIALLGLANSLVWPVIWPLAIKDLGRFTKIGSSLLVMGIGGGALLPLLYGYLADQFNDRDAYWILVPCYLFILHYAVSGHKIRK